MKKGEKMSNLVNDAIMDEIIDDVVALKGDDIWNVIFAIEKEFGIEHMPGAFEDEDDFIDTLAKLRFEARCI